MFNEIKDFAAPELDVYARTSEVQLLRYYEPEPGIFSRFQLSLSPVFTVIFHTPYSHPRCCPPQIPNPSWPLP